MVQVCTRSFNRFESYISSQAQKLTCMKYINLKNILLLIGAITIFLMLIVGIKYPKQIKRIIKRIVRWEYFTNRDSSCEQCDILFQDGVSEQEKAFQSEGIKPKKSFAAIHKLIDKHVLREIETCEDYVVEPMDASVPCLLPKGVKFLKRLSQDYRALCIQQHLEYVPFRITSATRTTESVKTLQQNNGNAIENSAHLRGKTLDISYLTAKSQVEQKRLFIKALATLKQEGLCYVKYEVNMKCLHITCR